ncbi:TnsA endonuclease C-terminal domain-containing protein [Alicyclobacillus fastidiosus]|uniref:TnsA endonuclease C-terminal domain-containing protein n=1 Tax=Alicyclobacillus fastidiosus TaxID=392011 RepID=A0ABY6ZHQ3_9BACL|nr:TnsA endonuclease C-terminal domain-containing protein [Alicyclobacillus fastidiosus]WAH42392.1 TnsA endonuclease C-terminal domain-containing protein [Alicyclobacillus fastidiosus]GMA64208.1 hypothetical protein GCM10025859_46480 [Alicyclobacillus fastidiosus]
MAKQPWTEEKMNKWLKQGRGQGELEGYRPWLTTQDYPSNGRSSRIKGWKTGRIHHFLSDIETRYFYLLEFDGALVWDIREHYPLIDIEDVLADCWGDINWNNYRDKESGTQYVLTVTFLLTLTNAEGNKRYIARSVKAAAELEKSKVLERFELTRRYFAEKQIDWGIVTQHDINVTRAKNIEWVHSAKNLNDGFSTHDVSRLKRILVEWLDSSHKSARDVTNALDSQFNLEPGSGLLLFRHLIANKQVLVDMDERIDLGKPVNQVVRGTDLMTDGSEMRDAVDR